MAAADHYEILQLTPVATFDQVHKAYRQLAMQYHPDRNAAPDAGAAMAAINEAYAVLSDPSRRRQYDRERLSSALFDVAGPILRAAYDTLIQQGWTLAQGNERTVVLEKDFRVVRVTFAGRVDN